MSKGILLFAFNNGIVDYYKMAVATAKRANYFLNLPVTLVTDKSSYPSDTEYMFDKVIYVSANTSNIKGKQVWINKGRHRAYELTPYDETILLDTDYLINSDKLLDLFKIYDDFMCPNRTSYIMHPDSHQEQLSASSYNTLWATIIAFKKTNKVKQIFECLEMVENNYMHYVQLYNMVSAMYRNDYGLTIAHRIVNGHYEDTNNYIPWSLTHIATDVKVYRNTLNLFNTDYTVMCDRNIRGKVKTEYCIVKDTDFHIMDKNTYMELVDE